MDDAPARGSGVGGGAYGGRVPSPRSPEQNPTETDSPGPNPPARPEVEIRRSARRRKTVSARWEGERVVVLMPAGLPAREEARLVDEMVGKLRRSRRRASGAMGDSELGERAAALDRRWLGGRGRPTSVRWVPSMTTRWGSASYDSREIRISEALREVPGYVLDYVLVHELAHLAVPGGHHAEFWEAVRGYPRTERAMGFLEAHARVLGRSPGDGGVDGEGDHDLVDGD